MGKLRKSTFVVVNKIFFGLFLSVLVFIGPFSLSYAQAEGVQFGVQSQDLASSVGKTITAKADVLALIEKQLLSSSQLRDSDVYNVDLAQMDLGLGTASYDFIYRLGVSPSFCKGRVRFSTEASNRFESSKPLYFVDLDSMKVLLPEPFECVTMQQDQPREKDLERIFWLRGQLQEEYQQFAASYEIQSFYCRMLRSGEPYCQAEIAFQFDELSMSGEPINDKILCTEDYEFTGNKQFEVYNDSCEALKGSN